MIKLNKTQQFTDVIHGTIVCSGLEDAIISTPIFNRLHRILQSSLVYLTYSSNKVKRFEHSIGTMYLAGKMFFYSVCNSKCASLLLNEAKREITNWYTNKDFKQEKALKDFYLDKYNEQTIIEAPIPQCNLYNINFPQNISQEDSFVYLLLFQSVRISGLLHDVGHLPYSHVFEHAARELYNMVKNKSDKNEAETEFLQIMKNFCETADLSDYKELHEALGLTLIKQIKAEVINNLNQSEENFFILAVLDFAERILSSNDIEETLYSDLHRIVAGVIDADRLDYCTRDAFCSGARQDKFPYDRFLCNYRLIVSYKESDKTRFILGDAELPSSSQLPVHFLFCPALKNLSEVEDLLDRRWKITTNINFHHRVHKHEIIFSEILAKIGYDELESLSGKLPKLQSEKLLPLKLSSIWSLVKKLKDNKSLIDYLVIQLDDSWMDTFLKFSFFEKYGNDFRNEEKYMTDSDWNKFDELISTKKHYFSVYKRPVDFFEFDKMFETKWIQYVEKSSEAQEMLKVKDSLLSMAYTKIKPIASKRGTSSDSFYKPSYGIFASIILPQIALNTFYQEVELKLNKELSTFKGKEIGISNCMIRACDLKIGITSKTPVLLWEYDKDCKNFISLSSKFSRLKTEQEIFTPFHLYYLPDSATHSFNKERLEETLSDIIIEISKQYCRKH